jgi:xylulose-5-phosphate/fructose-6-phosphate phosphoketolase
MMTILAGEIAEAISVGQIYRYDNPLLRKPLELSHVKPLVVGHWGTTPGRRARPDAGD